MKRDVCGEGGQSAETFHWHQYLVGRRLWSSAAVTLTILTFTRTAAFAETITFGFTGTVTKWFDTEGVYEGMVETGDPISGWYSFDSETPDARPDSSQVGKYEGAGPISFQAGQIVAESRRDATIAVLRGVNAHSYGISPGLPFQSGDFIFDEGFWLKLVTYRNQVFESDALPLIPPDVSQFEGAEIWFMGYTVHSYASFGVRGSIDTLTLIPEPATATTVMVLCVGSIFRRQRFC